MSRVIVESVFYDANSMLNFCEIACESCVIKKRDFMAMFVMILRVKGSIVVHFWVDDDMSSSDEKEFIEVLAVCDVEASSSYNIRLCWGRDGEA